jgi:hypothetical protein
MNESGAHREEYGDTRFVEMANRHQVISLALKHGFNAFLPLVDQGIDFILHREADERTLKVQLKSRWTINRKYLHRGIHIAFPMHKASRAQWYLAEHDGMVELALATMVGKSASWLEKGKYSSAAGPPLALRSELARWAIEEVLCAANVGSGPNA